jgi:hypothetical protein
MVRLFQQLGDKKWFYLIRVFPWMRCSEPSGQIAELGKFLLGLLAIVSRGGSTGLGRRSAVTPGLFVKQDVWQNVLGSGTGTIL